MSNDSKNDFEIEVIKQMLDKNGQQLDKMIVAHNEFKLNISKSIAVLETKLMFIGILSPIALTLIIKVAEHAMKP